MSIIVLSKKYTQIFLRIEYTKTSWKQSIVIVLDKTRKMQCMSAWGLSSDSPFIFLTRVHWRIISQPVTVGRYSSIIYLYFFFFFFQILMLSSIETRTEFSFLQCCKRVSPVQIQGLTFSKCLLIV